MAGRPRGTGKPSEIKILEGTVRKRDRTRMAGEPQPPGQIPLLPPEGLSWRAVEEWARVSGDLVAMRVGKRVDAVGLMAYCEAVARFREANEDIAARGILVREIAEEGEPLRRNPAVLIAERASEEIRKWAREFGLTPAARTGIQVNVSVSAAPPAARFLEASR